MVFPMNPLLKPILKNGLLSAGALAIVGYGYAELAGMWLAAQTPLRTTPDGVVAAAPQEAVADSLQYRVPAMMALWGFVFVALGEVVLHRVRSRRAALVPPAIPQPDPAELLMKQMMLDAQAASSPSTAPAENSPVAN